MVVKPPDLIVSIVCAVSLVAVPLMVEPADSWCMVLEWHCSIAGLLLSLY